MLPAAAYRTFEPVGPTRCDHDRAALLLGAVLLFEGRFAETFLELHGIARHRYNLMKSRRIPRLLPGVS
jgi:hypothetical protein